MQNESCDIGLIGLAVMGQNLVLNMNDHGYRVAVFNRTVSKVDEFIGHEAAGTQVVGAHSIEELVKLLKKVTSSSTAAIRFSLTRIAAPQLSRRREFSSLVPVFPVAKKERVSDHPLCLVETQPRGPT
jgi:glutamyl-tRNA reductase